MHTIYIQALVELFHQGMESWARGDQPDPRIIKISRWIIKRDASAYNQARSIVVEERTS